MSVSRAEVIAAYRALHGRNPESDQVVESLTGTSSLEALLNNIVSSNEFATKMRRAHAQQPRRPASQSRPPAKTNVYNVTFDPAGLKAWLEGIETDAANALLPAIEDGVFNNFFTTPDLVDVCLDSDNRKPLLPFAEHIRIPAAIDDYSGTFAGRDGPARAVVLANVLQHIANPLSLLRSLFEILDVEGILLITVPHRDLYERKFRPPSRFSKGHRRFYTLDRLLLEIQAACGINAFRLRFAKEYDNGHDYQSPHAQRATGIYSALAVFEKIGRQECYEDLMRVRIERIPQYEELAPDSVVYANPKSLLSGGVSIADISKVIVLKLDHIGDFAIAVPRFIELRALFPTATITLVCGSWNRPLAESLKLFDSIITCDYYKEDQKQGGREQSEKTLQAQLLGERLKDHTFDLALDFRVPSDSRHLLQVTNARIRAGIARGRDVEFLDIALPNLEAFYSEVRREVREAAILSFSPKAFKYQPRTQFGDNLALCFPTNEQFFVWGSRANLDKGAYEGALNLGIFEFGPESPVEVVFDVCTNNGGSVFVKSFMVTKDNSKHQFRFEVFADLADVELRIRLASQPKVQVSLVFMGLEMAFASATPFRRVMPTATVHIGEQLTLLLALLRTRLTEAIDVEAIRSRLAASREGADDIGGKNKFILIAPLSNSLLRDWPASEYIALARSILDRTTADIILVGSGKQEAEMLRMADEIGDDEQPSRLTVIAGSPWKEVIPKIIGAESTITNNSGIAHIAALLGARSISIYSASHQTIEWGPVGENSVTVQAHVECGPCGFDTLRECTNGHRCMQAISRADVLETLRKQCTEIFVEAQADS